MVCGRANQQLAITNNKNIPYGTGLVKRFFSVYFCSLQKNAALLHFHDIFCNLYSTGLDKTIRFLYT